MTKKKRYPGCKKKSEYWLPGQKKTKKWKREEKKCRERAFKQLKKRNGIFKHKAKKTIIKNEMVDIEIRPVVNWLNSFRDVVTLYSCEGDESNMPFPYVLFVCTDPMSLLSIVDKTRHFGRIYLDLLNGVLRYDLRFNEDCLEHFKEHIGNKDEGSRS